MNIKKSIVSVVAAAVFFAAIPLSAPMYASAETVYICDTPVCELGSQSLCSEDGAYQYYVDETQNAAVIGQYNGADSVVNVPAEIDGYPVIGILNGAFANNRTITSVVIPEGVEFVGTESWEGNSTNFTGAFQACTNLTSVTLPDSLWHIGINAFLATGLRSVTVPENVSYIGGSAFAGCTSLTNVRLPEGITCITDNCFMDCTSLQTIKLPSTVTDIFGCAFKNCTSLTTIVFPETMTMSLIKKQMVDDTRTGYQFEGCTSLQSVTLPDSMTCIPFGMFKNSGLSGIKIGSGTTSIGCNAFYGCTFTDLYLPDGTEIIGSSSYLTLEECTVTGTLSVPAALEEQGGSISHPAEYEVRGVYTLKIEQSEIGSNILNFYFPEGKTVFSPKEVYGFGSPIKAFLPDTVTKITAGSSDKLTSLTLGGGVIDMELGALDNCPALEEINVSKAGKYLSYDGTLFSDGGYTFAKFPNNYKGSSYPVEFTIPDGTKKIADGAFRGNTSICLTLYIPESVTEIGEENFYYIDSDSSKKGWNLVINGKAGSEAERFANEHNIMFHDTSPAENKYDYYESVLSPQTITRENTNFTQPTFAGDHGEVKGTLVYTDNYGSVMTYEGVKAILANYRSGTYKIGYRFTPDSDSVYGGVKTGTITLDMTKIPVSAPVVTITAESSRVLLSWAAVDEAIAYEINLMDGDSFVKVGDTTQTSFAYTDVTENESYSFLVRAYDGDTFSDYTDDDIVTAIVRADDVDPLAEVYVAAHNLILADNIGVNFYMSLPEEILNDSETYMKFSLPNGFVSRVFISDAKPEMLDGKTCYKFPCYVAAAEMTDTITARLYYRGECSEEYTYSVDEYAQSVLENPERYTDTVPVVKAMLNYGSRAQEFFGHNTEHLANELLPAEERAVTEAADIDLSVYKPAVTDNDADLSFKGMVISLKSRIGLKLYFESESELALSDFTITDGTNAVSDSRLSTGTDDNGFYLAVSDITAADFDRSFTVSCGNLTVRNISVFSYIRQALTGTDSALAETAASIYDYNRAIEAYIAAQQSSQTE